MVFVSADWSKKPGKRSVHVAYVANSIIRSKENHEWTLSTLLDLARTLSSGGHGPVLVGLDVALGVPCSYWKKTREFEEWGHSSSFVHWLAKVDPDGSFFKGSVSTPDDWKVERPWFRVPEGPGGLKSFAKLDDRGFLRTIDACTGAKPLFATSGIPGTVGSGTRALWGELIPELRRTDLDFRIWPFEDGLDDLARGNRIVLAETYPGFSYAAALCDELPAKQLRIGKTKRAERERACKRLEESEWVKEYKVDLGCLREPRENEDAFDSYLTAAGLLRCKLEGKRFAESPWIDSTVEGSMLLAGPVWPKRPEKHAERRAPGPDSARPPDSGPIPPARSPVPTIRTSASRELTGTQAMPDEAANERTSLLPPARIESVAVRGFRSLADVSIDRFADVTALIGANGSGKSNFIRFFEMLSWMLKSRQLAVFVGKHGGGSDQLFGGSETTSRIQAEVRMRTRAGVNDYRFSLAHTADDGLIFTDEAFRFHGADLPTEAAWQTLPVGGSEARIMEAAQSNRFPELNRTTARTTARLLRDCAHYQFHNTSDTSPLKTKWDVHDNAFLRNHGGNLPAVLLHMQEHDLPRYEFLCSQIARVLPDFREFAIREEYGRVLVRWVSKSTGKEIGAHLTSDGSLRFFALATLLSLPAEVLPSVLFLDEPELGLHPTAVELIAGMIRSLGVERQVIIATQSPALVDLFELDEVIVLDSVEGRTVPRILNPSEQQYAVWLREGLKTGDLWLRNVLGGRP